MWLSLAEISVFSVTGLEAALSQQTLQASEVTLSVQGSALAVLLYNFRVQLKFFVQSENATYSGFAEERATTICLLVHQAMGASLM